MPPPPPPPGRRWSLASARFLPTNGPPPFVHSWARHWVSSWPVSCLPFAICVFLKIPLISQMLSFPRTQIRKFNLVIFSKLFREMTLTFNSVWKLNSIPRGPSPEAYNICFFTVDKDMFQRFLFSFFLSFFFFLHEMHWLEISASIFRVIL